MQILCNFDTIIKKIYYDNENKKNKYLELCNLVLHNIKLYNKRKTIIYVNKCLNAEIVFDLLTLINSKTNNFINIYIYIGSYSNINKYTSIQRDIRQFEEENLQSIIVSVGKIGYGYDNPYIDFIVLGDPKQSDIDIRQTIGRGLRWNKDLYIDKLLHIFVPYYKKDFYSLKENQSLKKYLDYIIGECGKDIIIKKTFNNCNEIKYDFILKDISFNYNIDNINTINNIDTEILKEYSTTGYNTYTQYMQFLKSNNVHNEETYINLYNITGFMINLLDIRKKYPKFCFQDLLNVKIKNSYYLTKTEAEAAILKNKNNYTNKYNSLKNRIKFYILNDNKIPPYNIDLYYKP
jgi:superfamily II DNA or RNA helicase